MKKRVEKMIVRVFKLLICVLWGLAASSWTAFIFIPIAFEERGYFAIGGEWLITVEVFMLVFWLTHIGLNWKEKKFFGTGLSKNDID